MTESGLMRIEEAADYLCVGKSTMWLYVKQGKITPVKLSGRVSVFQREELDRFIKNAIDNPLPKKEIKRKGK